MSSQPSVYVTRPDVDDSGLELLRKRLFVGCGRKLFLISLSDVFEQLQCDNMVTDFTSTAR